MANKGVSSRVVADYKDLTLPVSGEEIRVYRVPESWVNSVVPSRSRPRRPEVVMKTATGEQKRPAKSGDPEYEAWVVDKEDWEQERDELQEAVRLCLALRDYPIPDPLEFPPHIQDLIDDGLVRLPESAYMLDAMWLKAVPLAAMVDEMEVHYVIQLLGGISQEAIDQMKASFRNSVLGQASSAVGAGAGAAANGREPEADVQV